MKNANALTQRTMQPAQQTLVEIVMSFNNPILVGQYIISSVVFDKK